jgi:small subunit ribosomal protein S6
MVVLRADLQEAGVKEQLERLRKLLENNGAAVEAVHEWGNRELAYEIQKQRRGFYALFNYISSAAAVAELERQLKLSDVVLRFVSVRRDKDVPEAPAQPFEARGGDVGDGDDEQDAGGDADMADLE